MLMGFVRNDLLAGGIVAECHPVLRPNFPLPQGLCLLCCLLWGCAGVPPAPQSADFWIKGKIGVTYADRAFSANFVWAQRGNGFDIELWGPLGQGRTRLRGLGRRLEVLDGQGGVLAAGQREALMVERLGWSFPVDLFLDWINGRPSPGIPVRNRVSDSQSRLTGFEQSGWQVSYRRFQSFPAGRLPARITAQKSGSRINLAISERLSQSPTAAE